MAWSTSRTIVSTAVSDLVLPDSVPTRPNLPRGSLRGSGFRRWERWRSGGGKSSVINEDGTVEEKPLEPGTE